MHRWLTVVLLLLAAGVTLLGVRQWRESLSVDRGDEITLMLVVNPLPVEGRSEVLAAYESVLEEEGVPWRRLNQFRLLDIDPTNLAARNSGLVFPDLVCRTGLTPLSRWLTTYMEAGGWVLLVHDAGSRNEEGAFHTNRALRELLNLDVEDWDPDGRSRFGNGSVRFLSPDASREFGIPPGKLNDQGQLTGYGLGVMEYPLAIARSRMDDDSFRVWAWGENQLGLGGPVIVERRFGDGGLLFVGLPLGHLKGQSDDLPMRLVLRHFVDRRARLPRVLPVPRGVGGLVINWHVDAGFDLAALPRMLSEGFVDPDLPMSWHVTAGPDNNEPGDGDGFDACGMGRPLLQRLLGSGELGSHGGWAHNYFAYRLGDGRMSLEEARALIVKNRDCLAEIAAGPLREYSSPAGVHPQPHLTRMIEELGFTCFYYTGDGGSAPNRTFDAGAAVSSRLIAFPVLPMGGKASLGEFIEDPQTTIDDLAGWLDSVSRFCVSERTIRLVYAHPYDLYHMPESAPYRQIWRAWQRRLVLMQQAGELQVRTMGQFTEFLLRSWKTEAVFRRTADGLRVELRNPDGLRDITVAVPRMGLDLPAEPRVSITQDAERYYLTVEDSIPVLDVLLPLLQADMPAKDHSEEVGS